MNLILQIPRTVPSAASACLKLLFEGNGHVKEDSLGSAARGALNYTPWGTWLENTTKGFVSWAAAVSSLRPGA